MSEQQIIAELQQAVSNWQRRAYAAEDELKRLTSASSGAEPLSVEPAHLHPLADRGKSANSLDERFTYGDTSKEEADLRMAVAAQRSREQEADDLNSIKSELRDRMSGL